ncbi:MAG: FeoB-associated Cys-rich membrane protein [Clostridiales bacterium]|jgi:hypothetical protein|nr:FeoB-associated Cys-rich membrane protein [Clostridiales bacterium]
MNVFDIIILSIVALCAIAAIVYLVRLKKKGKSVCCGDCS